ncbi:MAG: hypothetical protein AB7F50_08050 [Fimbriimonadaceae bacterium]
MVARLALLVSFLALLLSGCGGGGGAVGGLLVTLTGRVIWVETGAAPNPAATVRSGSISNTTDLSDGFFTLIVPSGATSVTVTFTPTGGSAVVRTFTFSAATSDVDLGDLYIGPQVVTVTGRTVSSSGGAPIAGATVKLAGRSAVSSASGTFSIKDVAFSPAGLTVFLGLQGQATATGFFPRSWSPSQGPSGGVADTGDIAMTPLGSNDPPPTPFNLEGKVLPVADGPDSLVQILKGSAVIRFGRADALSNYRFWVPAGSYRIKATKGSRSGERAFTVTDPSVVQRVDVTLP